MDRSETLNLLAMHKPVLAARYGVLRLALFGSAARGTATASDLDILVTFDGPATSDRYFGVQFYLEDLLGHPVDSVTEKALRPRAEAPDQMGSRSRLLRSRTNGNSSHSRRNLWPRYDVPRFRRSAADSDGGGVDSDRNRNQNDPTRFCRRNSLQCNTCPAICKSVRRWVGGMCRTDITKLNRRSGVTDAPGFRRCNRRGLGARTRFGRGNSRSDVRLGTGKRVDRSVGNRRSNAATTSGRVGPSS